MARTIALRATRAFRHQGRTLAVGEEFTVEPVLAKLYTYRKQAEFASKAAAPAAPAATPKAGRTYKRRDLEAEQTGPLKPEGA